MKSQELTRTLTRSELACLQEISQHGDISAFLSHRSDLLQLIELRLIERVSQVWMPLEMKHDHYKLTALGHQVMSRHKQDG